LEDVVSKVGSSAPSNADFERFVYADVATEPNGMELSVLSALSRRGLDPWQEAQRLAQLLPFAAVMMAAIFGGLLMPLFTPKQAEPVAPTSWIADAPKAPVKPQAVPRQSASLTLPDHPEAPATTTPPPSVP
jgi:hypothetical protein